MPKAGWEARLGAEVVSLVPSHTGEGWWHRHVMPLGAVVIRTEDSDLGKHVVLRGPETLEREVIFLRRRVKHVERSGATGSARFSSAVVIFRRGT
jgi:hypothetical protein